MNCALGKQYESIPCHAQRKESATNGMLTLTVKLEGIACVLSCVGVEELSNNWEELEGRFTGDGKCGCQGSGGGRETKLKIVMK